jgi:hypothetical protein
MSKIKESLDIYFKAIFIISTIVLIAGFVYLFSEVRKISRSLNSLDTNNVTDTQNYLQYPTDQTCSENCFEQINTIVSEAVATLSGVTTETIIEKQTVVTKSSGTDYIPMGATATTQSVDWVDVDESAVYLNVEGDYGEDAVVSWEASLKVAHGNGKAFARIYDETNKIAVDFSEVSTENNADFVRVSSGNLPFWRGNNLYKVQIKSLNSFEVTYSGGKVIIRY